MVLSARGDPLELRDLPVPEPGPGQVRLRVQACGVFRTDLHVVDGELPHPKLPLVPGHQIVGVADDGRRLGVPWLGWTDGTCRYCTRGRESLCENLLPLLNGAYAELVVVPGRIARVNLHPVPRSLPSEVAALVEPLACALHAVAEIEDGATVAVLGPGPMGIMLCACLRDAGATPVIMGGSPERRALAHEFGAVAGDARDADVVIEATGKPKGWRDAVRAVDRGGTVILFGGVQGDVELDAEKLHYDEVTVRGAFHHTPRTVRAALAFLASGAYPWRKLLTHEVSLADLPAFFAEPPDGYLKAVVRP
jgi:L-iditol 2-dehydrogenase